MASAADDDERVDVVAGGDVDVTVDGQDEAAGAGLGSAASAAGAARPRRTATAATMSRMRVMTTNPLVRVAIDPVSNACPWAGRSGHIARASRRG